MRKVPEPVFDEYDEHNQPTEPMSVIILSPYAAPTYQDEANGGASNNSQTIPVPPAPELPFRQNARPVGPYHHLHQAPRAYPVLPPSPIVNHRGRPPGGASPFDENVPSYPNNPHHSSLPSFVSVVFLVAQILLLARVALLLFGILPNTLLIELVYAPGALFAWPFHLLLEQINPLAQIGAEWINTLAAIIAILAYGVIGRIVVRFLKALLNSG